VLAPEPLGGGQPLPALDAQEYRDGLLAPVALAARHQRFLAKRLDRRYLPTAACAARSGTLARDSVRRYASTCADWGMPNARPLARARCSAFGVRRAALPLRAFGPVAVRGVCRRPRVLRQ
jgi:hypothetical protein